MWRNYFKTGLRALWKTKTHSLINILGLSLGIACCVLIALFVRDEFTYDHFHRNASRIYRVWAKEDWGENQQFFGTETPFPMGPALKENFEEVEAHVRINKILVQVKVGDNMYNEALTIAGEDLFDVFDFEVVAGDRNALHAQRSVVINTHTAQKYFGNENPINQTLSIQLGETFEDFVVAAVTARVPSNSSIRFYLLISDLNYPKLYSHQALTSAWFSITPETYVMLREGTDPRELEAKFPPVFKTLLGEDDYNQSHYTPGLQPLTDIHLNKDFPVALAEVNDPKYAYILAAIALLILAVACINFVTLAVGRSIARSREVGIRKVVGAVRKQLIFQFVGEALMVTLISLVIGMGIALLCLPVFNDLAAKQLELSVNAFTVLLAILLLSLIGILAGSYPAFVLSAFRPIETLKGKVVAGSGKQGLRKTLVGVQLVLSIFLISSTLIMQRQLSYLQNKNLGFNRDQLIVVPLHVPRVPGGSERIEKGFDLATRFKTALGSVPAIVSVCASGHEFGVSGWTNIGYTDDKGTYREFNVNFVDDSYCKTLDMQFAAGRNFLPDNAADARRSVIVNEAFVKAYGWSDAIGKKIPGKNFNDHEIIGVVKDFNFESLHTAVLPLALMMNPRIAFSGSENVNMGSFPVPRLMIKISAGEMVSTIEKVKEIYSQLTTGEEFSFTFVDETLAQQYRSEINLGKIVRLATLLAIVIGCLGLYALASLAMQHRKKEISIRKVLGATEPSLLVLLSRDYVVLITICLLLSVPFTLYFMRSWLESFEYRIPISWTVFALSGGLSLAVACLTIGYQAIKTAWSKPAETLKYE